MKVETETIIKKKVAMTKDEIKVFDELTDFCNQTACKSCPFRTTCYPFKNENMTFADFIEEFCGCLDFIKE